MTGASLLPTNATPWETAVSRVSALRRPLDSDIIRRVWDPALCPAHVLYALASALGLKIYDPAWPEHKQRRAIANSIRLRRLEGTLAGIEGYAELVDSEVVRAIVPPGTFFLSGGLGDAERARLALVMPQIRIYRRSERASAGRRLFLTARRYSCLAGPRFVADSGAALRTQPRVVFAENDVERPVSVEAVVDVLPGIGRALYERALLRRPRRPGVTYFGQIPRFLVTLDPTRSIAAFRRQDGAPAIIRYGLKPASVDPEPFYAQGRAGRAFMIGQPPFRRYLSGTGSGARVYERIIVWDPDLIPRRRGASFLGVSRFGVASHTAEVTVHIPGERPRRAFGIGPRGFVSGFFAASDSEKYRATFRALRAAKAVRDCVLVNTTTFRSPKAGTLIGAGTPFTAGRLLRS